MTIEELKNDEWYLNLPEIIKQAIDIKSPLEKYSLYGKQCYIVSYNEPISGLLEDVTCIIQKTGLSYKDTFSSDLDKYQVFDVKLEDLELWDENKQNT